MSLKDWKKTKNTKDEVWMEKDNGSFLHILKLHTTLKRKFPWVVTNKEYDKPYLREYRMKSQALKFAKSYMRKH